MSEESLVSNDSRTKRVRKACDRCRVKKTKCDGSRPCKRCQLDDHVCLFQERSKYSAKNHYSTEYVQMLESQYTIVVDALAKVYARCVSGEGFPGGPLEDNGPALTHRILERLGLIEMAENVSRRYGETLSQPFPEEQYPVPHDLYTDAEHDVSNSSSRKSSGYDHVSSPSSASFSPFMNGPADHMSHIPKFLSPIAPSAEQSALQSNHYPLQQVPNSILGQGQMPSEGVLFDQFGFETPTTNALFEATGPFAAMTEVVNPNLMSYPQQQYPSVSYG